MTDAPALPPGARRLPKRRYAAQAQKLVLALMLGLAASSGTALAQAPAASGAGEAHSDDTEARELFRLGKQAFDESRYERALKYFKDAYELSHRAGLLSNIGTALDRLRRDEEALEAYRSYLAQVPGAPNRALIEERIRVIEAARKQPEAAPPAPSPQPIAPTPAATAQAQLAAQPAAAAPLAAQSEEAPAGERGGEPIYTRWWFWTGVGAVALTAVVIGVAASSGGGTVQEPPAVLGSGTRLHPL